jgi:hypothetical protein
MGSSLLGGQTTLVPFVYYLFHTPKHEVPTGQIDAFRKALHLSAFARPFSRYADSRLWKFIRREIKPLAEKKDYHFPFDQLVAWVKYWESVTGFDGAPPAIQRSTDAPRFAESQHQQSQVRAERWADRSHFPTG